MVEVNVEGYGPQIIEFSSNCYTELYGEENELDITRVE